MRWRRTGQGGVGMVEFAICLPFLLLVMFGMMDFGRAINANSTVADAARQGARQMAPNAATGDSPFGVYSGACSGTTLAPNAGGSGCLTDAAALATVTAVLAPLTTNVTHQYGVTAASCSAPAVSGQANVCLAPSQSATPTSNDSCSAATTRLGHTPAAGDLGGRQNE
ncbi:MAG TPA: TadE family protein [Candidatus Dormibacteraeota bacterium]|nr:TadE family protein [Candidatus Dormibacteraeota bacterium]